MNMMRQTKLEILYNYIPCLRLIIELFKRPYVAILVNIVGTEFYKDSSLFKDVFDPISLFFFNFKIIILGEGIRWYKDHTNK